MFVNESYLSVTYLTTLALFHTTGQSIWPEFIAAPSKLHTEFGGRNEKFGAQHAALPFGRRLVQWSRLPVLHLHEFYLQQHC